MGVTVAAGVLVIGMVVIFFYCLRKRAKIVEEIQQSESEVHHEKEANIIHEESNFDVHQASHMSEFNIVQNESKRLEHQGLDE